MCAEDADTRADVEALAQAAKRAERELARAGTDAKDGALAAVADALEERADAWLDANAADVRAARAAGMSESMLDRLTLTPERVKAICAGVRDVASLPDPVGQVIGGSTRPNGLRIEKVRVPLGVVGIIYEARPNVTVDAASLCLKSGNACVLRGGKEAIHSNRSAVHTIRQALAKRGLPRDCVCLVQDTTHEGARALMHADDAVDVLIPRGGHGLIRSVVREASVPVIRTGEGVCHVYVHSSADLGMAARILENAKCQRPSTCNSAECVVVDRAVARDFLDKAVPLLDAHHVELRCDEEALAILGDRGVAADASDWDAEYNDMVLAVHVVADEDEAIGFVSEHTTGHSECIVAQDVEAAQEFLDRVDAAAVYVNASTRFTDGAQFGLGAEIGISTQKTHARGPMGLEALTSYKYLVRGCGQVRE